MIGFQLVRIIGHKTRMGHINAVFRQYLIDVAVQKIVPKFVTYTESLETFIRNVGRVHNSERVAMPEQHAGNTFGGVRFCLDDNVATVSDSERINRKTHYAFLPQQE